MQASLTRQLHAISTTNYDHFSRPARQLFLSKRNHSSPLLHSHFIRLSKTSPRHLDTIRSSRSRYLQKTMASSSASASSKEGNPVARQHHPLLDAINESTKWMVSAAVFSTLAMRRDLLCAWWVLGSILAAVLCRALKYALNEARPPTARKADPGMPSSHANSLGFLTMFVSVWATQAAQASIGTSTGSLILNSSPIVFFLSLGIPALGLFLTWLRVALGYHTVEQVAAGWLLGSSIAVGWWHFGVKKAMPVLVQRPELQLVLYSTTTVAITFFIVSNVGRWIKEVRENKKEK